MRCFIAVDLDPKLASKVQVLQKELVSLDTKLVAPEDLHFTLKFLGEVDEESISMVVKRLKELAAERDSFDIDIRGAGVFPNEDFIRVVWIGAQKLANLQASVNQSLVGLFKKENPSPHLTIARVRSQKHKENIIAFVKRHKNIEIGRMKIKEIRLKKSSINSKGPVYEDIEIFELK